MPEYEIVAKVFCNAIREMDDEHINNLESYLSYHFPEWLKEWASTPADIALEMRHFATMKLD